MQFIYIVVIYHFFVLKGDEIQIGAKKDEYLEWIDKLQERKTYVMDNFIIVRNEEKFKAWKHLYRMFFISGTYLRETGIENMPPFSFKFAKFEDIIDNKLPTNYLIGSVNMVVPFCNLPTAIHFKAYLPLFLF